MGSSLRNSEMRKSDKSYYFNSDKFVRDLVHGYVYLTKFDMDLISTHQFQRLRDVRQLTCQSVYPSARHTRFEHSLGVMELTRQAICNLNSNAFISEETNNSIIIDEILQFNASIAALLHDIGHCPFSHMGEVEFDENEVWNRLYTDISDCEKLENSDLLLIFKQMEDGTVKKAGAIHEQLSCIMILEKFIEVLNSVEEQKVCIDETNFLYVDYELIIRCILGILYDTSTIELFTKNKEKNIIVNLINSKAFDMDKLDYIMRDSFYTGIGTPHIDTNRLFRNMYLNNENEYKIVFKNRAVPVLQNFIESRDSLYMYVYNHHTAVFSDFMSGYIFRRLSHNKRDLLDIAWELFEEKKTNGSSHKIDRTKTEELWLDEGEDINTTLGMVPRNYLFSVESIIEQNRSDSDLISLLNILHFSLGLSCNSPHILEQYIDGELEALLKIANKRSKEKNDINFSHVLTNKKKDLIDNIIHVYELIKEYNCHNYLKPWWKTNSEFNNFISTNFKDDRTCLQLCEWISKGKNGSVSSHEFRSQLAKNVIFITQKLVRETDIRSDLIKPLETGDFFVIQRSARFFDPDTISELDIALKSNEIIGSPKEVKYQSGEFYIKMLTNVIPQKDYYSMYARNSFYIFSKRLSDNTNSLEERNAHYHQIEQIFIFVAETLIADGERIFKNNYNVSKEKEIDAHKHMYERFKKFLSK